MEALPTMLVRAGLIAAIVAVSLAGSTDAVQAVTSALRRNDSAEALRLVRAALAESPKDLRLLTLEGIALTSLGRDREALAAYRSALNVQPDYVPALEGAAQIEYRTDDAETASLLDRLLKLKPDEGTAHAMRAVVAWKQKDCANAVRHFALSGRLIDSQPEALREYGVCLVRLGQAGPAVDAFRRLVAAAPGNRTAVYSLASAELMARSWNAAIETLKPLTDSANPEPQALDLSSTALEANGDTPGAVAALNKAISIEPRNPALYVDFAQLALAHKSWAAGLAMVNAGLKQLPDSAQLYMARGVLEVQMAHYDEADADFTKAERLDPGMSLGSTARGLSAAQQNDFDKALSTVEKELAASKSDPFLYYLLAEVLSSRGLQPGTEEFRRAEEAARKAIDLKPDFALARDILSRLYLQAGETDRAIEQCRLALKTDPLDATALYRLIRALQSTGREDKADEIASLLRRFAQVRAELRRKENEETRYQLVENGAPEQTTQPNR